MKIAEAKEIYSYQLNSLWKRKGELSKILEESFSNGVNNPNYDKLELSKELSEIEKEYEKTRSFMEQLQQKQMLIHNSEAAKQQGKSMQKAMDDMIKCLEIARRISSGGKVPAIDEKKLMDYNADLYMAAKNMAFMNKQKKDKKYDALINEEEEDQGESMNAREIAENTEVTMDLPEITIEKSSTESE